MHHESRLPRKRKASDISPSPSPPPESETLNAPISSSRLLSLPPELRNAIYRFVLLELRPIAIRDHTSLPHEPALLLTNRQIRHEATPIYYQENVFKVYIVDYDSSVYRAWYNSSPARRHSRKEYVIREATHWGNLVEWLKAYYHGKSSKPGSKRSGRPCVNASLFSLVQRMKKVQRLQWEQIEANLEEVHQALVAMDLRWR